MGTYKIFLLLPVTMLIILPFVASAILLNSDTVIPVENDLEIETNASSSSMINVIENTPQISTKEKIEILENNLKSINANITDIDANSDDEIKVKYNHKGRFLGILPVNVGSETSIKSPSNGTMETRTNMPWWNIFVTGTHNIDTAVNDSVSNIDFTNTSTIGANASLSINAKIINAIINAHEKIALAVD